MRWVLVSFSVNRSGDVPVAIQVEITQSGIFRRDHLACCECIRLLSDRPVAAGRPGPQVAKPERRQDVQFGRTRGRDCGS